MQWRYEEEEQLLIQLEEAAKLCWAEHVAQKARREAEKAKRQKVAEEKKKKKKTLEYLQQL